MMSFTYSTRDPLAVIAPYQNYSTNAIPSIIDIDPFTFETAVLIDVRKCSQVSVNKSYVSSSIDNQSDLFSVPVLNQQLNRISLPSSQNARDVIK